MIKISIACLCNVFEKESMYKPKTVQKCFQRLKMPIMMKFDYFRRQLTQKIDLNCVSRGVMQSLMK